MNYYQPRQMKNPDGTGGKWHYTRMNDERIWPVGYCAQGCPGHETPEEAREHQKQYDIDTAAYEGHGFTKMQARCVYPDCGQWTSSVARIVGGGAEYILCDEHRSKEGLAVVHEVGDVISSY